MGLQGSCHGTLSGPVGKMFGQHSRSEGLVLVKSTLDNQRGPC